MFTSCHARTRCLPWIAAFVAALVHVGCRRGHGPPPKPPQPTMEVQLPHCQQVLPPAEAAKLEEIIVVPEHYEAIRLSGTIEGQIDQPINVNLDATVQGQLVTFATGTSIVKSEGRTSKYAVMVEPLPPPGKYSLKLFLTPNKYLWNGQIEIKRPWAPRP